MDAMVDLETYGTKAGCVVRSIGAVFFDVDKGMGDSFYCNIDTTSCLDKGLIIDPKTRAWWEKQSSEAKQSLLVDPKPVGAAVAAFYTWYLKHPEAKFWCQGANFDAPILEAVFNACKVDIPWKFWAVRDTRTAYDLYGFDAQSASREGTYHNALADAKHQAKCLYLAKKLFMSKHVPSLESML